MQISLSKRFKSILAWHDSFAKALEIIKNKFSVLEVRKFDHGQTSEVFEETRAQSQLRNEHYI